MAASTLSATLSMVGRQQGPAARSAAQEQHMTDSVVLRLSRQQLPERCLLKMCRVQGCRGLCSHALSSRRVDSIIGVQSAQLQYAVNAVSAAAAAACCPGGGGCSMWPQPRSPPCLPSQQHRPTSSWQLWCWWCVADISSGLQSCIRCPDNQCLTHAFYAHLCRCLLLLLPGSLPPAEELPQDPAASCA